MQTDSQHGLLPLKTLSVKALVEPGYRACTASFRKMSRFARKAGRSSRLPRSPSSEPVEPACLAGVQILLRRLNNSRRSGFFRICRSLFTCRRGAVLKNSGFGCAGVMYPQIRGLWFFTFWRTPVRGTCLKTSQGALWSGIKACGYRACGPGAFNAVDAPGETIGDRPVWQRDTPTNHLTSRRRGRRRGRKTTVGPGLRPGPTCMSATVRRLPRLRRPTPDRAGGCRRTPRRCRCAGAGRPRRASW